MSGYLFEREKEFFNELYEIIEPYDPDMVAFIKLNKELGDNILYAFGATDREVNFRLFTDDNSRQACTDYSNAVETALSHPEKDSILSTFAFEILKGNSSLCNKKNIRKLSMANSFFKAAKKVVKKLPSPIQDNFRSSALKVKLPEFAKNCKDSAERINKIIANY